MFFSSCHELGTKKKFHLKVFLNKYSSEKNWSLFSLNSLGRKKVVAQLWTKRSKENLTVFV